MGVLEDEAGGRVVLRARHLVGRSSLAHLRLADPSVSGEHAALSWSGACWELHDLGSRNGTAIDGRLVASGERPRVAVGAVLRFGSGPSFRLVDDTPPAPMARALPSGEWVVGEGELLALPDPDHPTITVFRDGPGAWVVEHAGGTEPVEDGAELTVGPRRFALAIPDVVPATWESRGRLFGVRELALEFAVSRDEELAQLRVRAGPKVIDLGERAHHLVLLALARARIRDRAEGGLGEASCGWVYLDEVARQLDMDEVHVNVAIYRARKQLAAAGVERAAEIVERRKATRQLRIGVEHLDVQVS